MVSKTHKYPFPVLLSQVVSLHWRRNVEPIDSARKIYIISLGWQYSTCEESINFDLNWSTGMSGRGAAVMGTRSGNESPRSTFARDTCFVTLVARCLYLFSPQYLPAWEFVNRDKGRGRRGPFLSHCYEDGVKTWVPSYENWVCNTCILIFANPHHFCSTL